MPWENVVCEAKIQIELSFGKTATGTCDGILLPIERVLLLRKENDPCVEHTTKLWKCHKCGREIK